MIGVLTYTSCIRRGRQSKQHHKQSDKMQGVEQPEKTWKDGWENLNEGLCFDFSLVSRQVYCLICNHLPDLSESQPGIGIRICMGHISA